jgi:hypothetical protein
MRDEPLYLDTEPKPRRWRLPFSWMGMILLAWMVFEVTRSPALGAVCICLKFGWDDARTAWWLFRRDPDHYRARTLLCLYLAWAIWKVAVVGFVMSLAFAAVVPRRMPLPAAPPQALLAFVSTFLTAVIGFLSAGLLTLMALLLAWVGRCRLWLDSGVRRARRFDYWPPTPFCLGRTNYLPYVILSTIILVLLLAVITLGIAGARGRVGVAAFFILSIFSPVIVLLLRESLVHRVGAETPQECWPEEWDVEQPWQEEPSVR